MATDKQPIHRKTSRLAARCCATFLAALALAGPLAAGSAQGKDDGEDFLYVGDGGVSGDDTVKRFDARTGAYLGTFVSSRSGGLSGPRGLIFIRDNLLAVNQNVNQTFSGEVLRYSSKGDFLGALVPCNPTAGRPCDPNAPFSPQGGIIRGLGSTVYLTDYFGGPDDFGTPGRIAKFDSKMGKFIENFDNQGSPVPVYPRGIVLGPDGYVYVSVSGNRAQGDGVSGYVLRFNPVTGKFVDTFASHQGAGCAADLHRPDGLVFGPDKNLYLVSFRADAEDTDKILVFNPKGQCVKKIDLYNKGEPRAFAQALVFGPKGKLFVPINNTGEVRRYDVKTGTYDIFIAAGGPLLSPYYLTFGETDPTTLEYDD